MSGSWMSRITDPDLPVLRRLQGLGAVLGGGKRDPGALQHLPDHLAEEALVVDDQDPRGLLRHGTPIGRLPYKM